MAVQSGNGRQDIINTLRAYFKGRVPESQALLLETFAQRYYASAPLEDLYAKSIEDLFGALFSHWNFIYQRAPMESKVRIFNPTLKDNGWQSKYSIIEVSHDDIPFLVDSIRMVLNRRNILIHLAIHCGGLKVVRDADNKIIKIVPVGENCPGSSAEAPIYFEIDKQTDPEVMADICSNIEQVLCDVRVSVADWRKMVERAKEALSDIENSPATLDAADVAESKDFLRWLIDNHFTFLGARDYKLIGDGDNRALQIIPGSGLGVLREDSSTVFSKNYADLPPQARKLALSKDILIIAKTNTKATIHRDAYTDDITIKCFDEKGELTGERRFIGLYTSTAYHSRPEYIPFLRHKVAKVMEELHFPPDSHNGKEVVHILETLPRDDLFQATHEELLELTLGILQLQERKRVRLFVRKDSFDRYFSCLVYVPREIFTTSLCIAMEEVLMCALSGIESSYTSYFSESVLARIHYIIRVNPKDHKTCDIHKIEQELIATARSWSDELKTELIKTVGEETALKYYAKYAKAFPGSYCEDYPPAIAVNDIKKMEELSLENPLSMLFFKDNEKLRLKLFHAEQTIALSDVMPTLENMGLRIIGERPHEVIFKDGSIVWISDFDMEHAKKKDIDLADTSGKFLDAFRNIWLGKTENDGFNQLILASSLTWRETAILRAYSRYLRQIGFTFSQNYIEQALINNSSIAKNLIAVFFLRFSPDHHGETTELVAQIEKSLDDVVSLDEDRILRKCLEVIQATIRTNYFQKSKDNQYKDYFSFKFDPSLICDLPLPKPVYEIFVYSPQVEGVHLRAGKVARGGIRWSDRREDFRTEVLGLMKAQNVKNSVIVPVGAKGGFFPKQLPTQGDRDAIMKEVIASYSLFIRGLLDITDNIIDQKIVFPADVIRYDEDDTYLVVAADKGTATFSDIANGIAKEYNFWLDDAFASGGSVGYDHKKMGITARGAWESVKRHFCELGVDVQSTDFTVIGIGDMSGDVFGNGMLMSKHIRLVGAFDHRHIFLDPNPNAAMSYEERKRLFALPRSSWQDYNPELISTGGGVFSRAAKSIKLSPELQKALNTTKSEMVPNDLIKTMLKAPVDLIFNGGIGTFVKASFESHSDVGDRASDGIRVDGNEVTARVIAEGGNLGLTQCGRVEYSLNGGIIYTDFIDNAGGVDCSDHEVNLKILLNNLVKEGSLTLPDRNKLLEKMTNEVAELVLRDNYEQTQMLSLEASVATRTNDLFRRYIGEMEKIGHLNRKLEFLPNEKTLLERKANGMGLTRPEIAIMIAYCKMFLKQAIMQTNIPEDGHFIKYLAMAFPKCIYTDYLEPMKQHSLRREIISTQLAKNITDHMGVNFVERLQRETGASIDLIIKAYIIAEEIFDMTAMWHQIEALDTKVPTAIQQKMMLQIYLLVRRATRWFLRNRTAIDIHETIESFKKPIQELILQLPMVLPKIDNELLEQEIKLLVDVGVPESLAKSTCKCEILFTSLDIVEAATKNGFSIEDIATVYYALDSSLELNWLRSQMNAYVIDNQWDELARSGFRDDLDRAQRKLSISVLKSKSKRASDKTIEQRIEAWIHRNNGLINRWQNLLADIKSSTNIQFVTYSVVLRELADFALAG